MIICFLQCLTFCPLWKTFRKKVLSVSYFLTSQSWLIFRYISSMSNSKKKREKLAKNTIFLHFVCLIICLLSVNLELIHDLWVPNIYIYNLKSFKVIDVLSKLAGLWINNRKEIYYSQATHITFICPMLFDSFPLDTQVCKFQVSSIFSPFFICYCCTWCNFGSRSSVLHLDRKKNKKGLYNSRLYLVVIKICTLKETKKMCQWNSH